MLVVGYCSPNTLGHRIARGDKVVSIYGNKYQVNAQIREIDALSGHGDYEEMGRYLSCQNPAAVRSLFLVHGERPAQEFYSNYLKEKGFQDIQIPDFRSEVIL